MRKKNLLIIFSVFSVFLFGFNEKNTASSDLSEKTIHVNSIIKDTGKIIDEKQISEDPPVFIFEEYHTSNIAQLEIAVMLIRLRNQYGLDTIGLEGFIQRKQPLNANWFHNIQGKYSNLSEIKENTALKLLEIGEISASEFMALMFNDINVVGIEKAEEYNIEPSGGGGITIAQYLYAIAEKKLSIREEKAFNKIIKQGELEKILKYLENSDQWVKNRFSYLRSSPEKNSIEKTLKEINKIILESDRLKIEIPSNLRTEIKKEITFLETALIRDKTMSEYILNMNSKNKPIAMIIGGGHSKGVTEILKNKKKNYYLIRPLHFYPGENSLSSEEYERKIKKEWGVINGVGNIGKLLNNNRKPSPMIEQPTAKSYASALIAGEIIADARNRGLSIPNDIIDDLKKLPEFKIEENSFEIDYNDVIYSAFITTVDGNKNKIWFRAGTIPKQSDEVENRSDTNSRLTVEEKIMEKITSYSEGKEPPEKPTSQKKSESKILAIIGKNKGVIAAKNKSSIINMSRISG